jgi:hypothetical protein
MGDPDELIVIASHLRPEEAGMLRGLLESAGITAVVRDDMLSAVNPFLQPAIGGAKLAVRAVDEPCAREIVQSAGVLPGEAHDEPVDIPEEEWSRLPDRADPPSASAPRPTWPRRVAMAAPLVLVILAALWRCGAGAVER